jgi:hypothetical protein
LTSADRIRLRDALVELMSVRKNFIFTEAVIRERAANGAFYLEELVDSLVIEALKDAARGEVIVGSIEGREPWNERGSETKSGSPSPESSGPVPAEKLTNSEITKVSGLDAATAAQPTQGQRRISAGRMGRHLEDLDDETPEELARRLIK